jgi:hAT family protein
MVGLRKRRSLRLQLAPRWIGPNARHKTQPDMARFALDMLAIPMMSAECESYISAKYLITNSHNRLNPDIIEASECLKHWYG